MSGSSVLFEGLFSTATALLIPASARSKTEVFFALRVAFRAFYAV